MKKPSLDRLLISTCTAALCLGVAETVMAGAPSQTPLLARQPVPPNIVFTLDDSGSMLSPLMPESYTSGPAQGVEMQTLTPQEQQRVAATVDNGTKGSGSSYGYSNQLLPTRHQTTTSGAVTAALILDDAKRRSSNYNTIYYNPEVRYEPWVLINPDGSTGLYPYPTKRAVTISGTTTQDWVVPIDPMASSRRGSIHYINLSKTGASAFTHGGMNSSYGFVPIDHVNVAWCAIPVNQSTPGTEVSSPRPGTEGNRCATYPSGQTTTQINNRLAALRDQYDPAVFYTFNTSGTPTRHSLNDASVSSYTRSSARTDCTVSGSSATCTKDQEFRNFATWFTYYRNRLLLAKAAVGKAFASPRITDFRFGYGALNNPIYTSNAAVTTNVDGVSTRTLVQGVRNYSSIKPSFYNWLYGKIAYNGTPLRRATDDVGIYFSRTDSRSPWSDDPSSTTSTANAAAFAGCRRSYHILTTDGYWSAERSTDAANTYSAQTEDARKNVDGSNGPTIEYRNARGQVVKTYQYLSADNRRYKDDRENMLGDVAMYYWNRDLLADTPNNGTGQPGSYNPTFWQNVTMYTVGLGTASTIDPAVANDPTSFPQWPTSTDGTNLALSNVKRADDLIHAAINTRGLSLSAADALAFESSINAILEDIANQGQTTAGVGVSGAALSTGFAKYSPSYETGTWKGNVEKFELSATTGLPVDQVPSTPEVIDPVWSAASLVPEAAVRNIHVWVDGSNKAKPFTWANLTTSMKSEISTVLTASEGLVNYLRGDASNEGTGATNYRRRVSRLGDIVNSPPLYVKNTINYAYTTLPMEAATTYGSFVKSLDNREAMVFAGANDGMLHAFSDSTGAEVFAYIPRAVLPTLAKLSGRTTGQTTGPFYSHQYYVDGPLTEVHAHLSGQWKSLLIGSMGAGAKGLFAIDITNTTELKNSNNGGQKVMWELNASSSTNLGHIYSEIEVGPIKTGTNEYKWVALVGNGFNSSSNKAQLLVVDVADGTILRTLNTDVGSADSPNGLGGVRAARDNYGVIKAAYAGDEQGNLWRFDLNGAQSEWAVAFSGKPLFKATDTDTTPKAQPITTTPSVLRHPRGGSMVVFGTGKLIEDTDRIDAPVTPAAGRTGKLGQVQALYGIWDTYPRAQRVTATPSISKSNLVQQTIDTNPISGDGGTFYATSENIIDWSTKKGWYMNLTLGTGQRVIYPIQTLRGYVLVNSVVPSSGGMCEDSSSFNAVLNALTGSVNYVRLFDVNGDGVINNSDSLAAWYPSESDGGERIIGSAPRPRSSDSGNGPCGSPGQYLVISTTGGTKRCLSLGENLGARTWRIINNPPR